MSPFVIVGVSSLFCCFYSVFDVASDLGLHCLPLTLNGFSDKNRLTFRDAFMMIKEQKKNVIFYATEISRSQGECMVLS